MSNNEKPEKNPENVREKDKHLFKIFTSALETLVEKSDGEVKHRLRGIASGTALDAEGDRMSEKALCKIEQQIIGLTLHKDHVFKVDNTLGHFTNAKVIASDDGDVRELWVEAELEPFDVNPDAKRVFEKIKSGTRLGFSVAGMLRDWQPIDSEEGKKRFLITDIELLSVDLVTIPAYRASQGSVSAFEDCQEGALKISGEIYVCKQIGAVIRNCETDKCMESETVVEPVNLEDRLEMLEQKVNQLEDMVTRLLEKAYEVNPDTERIIERIERIEASVVEPPKSKGVMILPDGRIRADSEEIEAFERGAGNLIGKI